MQTKTTRNPQQDTRGDLIYQTNIVRRLRAAFEDMAQNQGLSGVKAERTSNNPNVTDLYDLQVTFSYFVDNITRGPAYIAPKIVSECEDWIQYMNSRDND
jgi:hypothetical protein